MPAAIKWTLRSSLANVCSTDNLCKQFRSSSGPLNFSMDVIISHTEARFMALADILISCALFINGTYLIEEGLD